MLIKYSKIYFQLLNKIRLSTLSIFLKRKDNLSCLNKRVKHDVHAIFYEKKKEKKFKKVPPKWITIFHFKMFSLVFIVFVSDLIISAESRNRFGFFTEAPAFTPPSIGPATLPPDFQPRISIRGSITICIFNFSI